VGSAAREKGGVTPPREGPWEDQPPVPNLVGLLGWKAESEADAPRVTRPLIGRWTTRRVLSRFACLAFTHSHLERPDDENSAHRHFFPVPPASPDHPFCRPPKCRRQATILASLSPRGPARGWFEAALVATDRPSIRCLCRITTQRHGFAPEYDSKGVDRELTCADPRKDGRESPMVVRYPGTIESGMAKRLGKGVAGSGFDRVWSGSISVKVISVCASRELRRSAES